MLLGRIINRSDIAQHVYSVNNALFSVRNLSKYRTKPPGVARNLQERLAAMNRVSPVLTKRIDIGYPEIRISEPEKLTNQLRELKQRRKDSELEKFARKNKLLIDLQQVHKEGIGGGTEERLRRIADHYAVFEHLYGYAYFAPRVTLDIRYAIDEKSYHPVFFGNMLKPAEALQAPTVSFDGEMDPMTGKKSKKQSYWTLLATNPDAHFTSSDSEYVHWFISNIPNGNVNKGEQLVSYLPPFPARGLGYQRFIFVLYKQDKRMDFNDYKLSDCDYANLEKRTFKTLDFYRKYQSDITPAGLAFYQTDWDTSLTKFYHDVLNIKEPIYEYDFPKPYIADQKRFPLKMPFNTYMDKYRDPQLVNMDYVKKLLAKTHPFNGPEAPLKYPNAHPIRGVPSWLRDEIRKERLKRGRVLDY